MRLFTTPAGLTLNMDHIIMVFPVYKVGDYGHDYMVIMAGNKEARCYFSGPDSEKQAETSRSNLIYEMGLC